MVTTTLIIIHPLQLTQKFLKMKQTISLISFLFFITSIQAQEAIEGIWDTGKENTQVQIQAIENQYEGTIISSGNSEAPIGDRIIKEVSQDGDIYKGKLYAAKKKKWVKATFSPTGQILVITISVGWRKKTVEWKKVN